MNAGEKAERLLELEAEYGLFDRQYHGVYYWHLIRRWILTTQGNQPGNDPLSLGGGEDGRRSRVRGILRDCLLQMGQFPLKQADVLLSASHANQRMLDGEYFDPWFRFITLPAGWRMQVLESAADYARRPTRGCVSRCYLDLKRLCRYACIRIWPARFADEAEDAFLETLAALLNKEIQSTLPESVLQARVRYSVASFSAYYAGLKKYLQKISPKLVLMVCAYNLTHFAMAYAARELGIPTAELQHGNILRFDIAYNFKEQESSGRYYPNYIFTFGQFWNGQARLPQGCRALAVGNVLTDFYRQKLKDVRQDPKGVVFYSNATQDMADMACALADLAIPAGYTVTFKYHPTRLAQERGRYPQLAAHGVSVEETAVSVYEYLAADRHHVGGTTTCLTEAMVFGGYGYMLKLPYYRSYQAFIDAGCIALFETAEALFAAIQKNSGGLAIDQAMVQSVWRSDAARHTQAAIEAILQNTDREGTEA